MIRLTRVELARLLARRIVPLAVLAALAIGLMTVYGVFQTAWSIDQARAGADDAYERIVEEHAEFQRICLIDERAEQERTGDPTIDFGCDQPMPTIEEMYGSMPSLFTQFEQLFGVLPYPLMFLALAMGSTAVAAEFAHRTMGSWLTFEPRRTRVFLSKVVAPALAAIPAAVVGLATVFVGVPAVFRWFRIDEGLSAQEWADLGWMTVRILALVVLAGAFGAAMAFVLRHSALVVGLIVGYLVLVEGMLSAVLSGVVNRLTLGRNIAAVIHDGTQWESWPQACGGPGMVECVPTLHTLTMAHGITVLSVVLVLVTALGWFLFLRSDVD